jgi:hypothetical protein
LQQTTTTENKTRKILDTLRRRGSKVAKGLHEAFINTSNEELAKLLAPYIKQIQSEGNKITPEGMYYSSRYVLLLKVCILKYKTLVVFSFSIN